MELTPKRRISLMKSKTQTNIREHFSRINPKRQENPILSETKNNTTKPTTSSGKILEGVVACLDVRTEDGDDVSINFERALQSMGAKTRRVFSDSVTHLVFKNGSPATLKKALSKKVFIVNLLWISRCKREGKRLPEKDFIIEKPQEIALTRKKPRKSMEPAKVKSLDGLEPSNSTSSLSLVNDDTVIKNWASKKRATLSESEMRKRHIAEIEAQERDNDAKQPRLSLPITLERVKEAPKPVNIIPIHAPSIEKQELIKARFSIGQIENEETKSDPLLSSPRLSFSPSNSPTPPLLKRKRRLTGNLPRPPLFSSSSSTSTKSK